MTKMIPKYTDDTHVDPDDNKLTKSVEITIK